MRYIRWFIGPEADEVEVANRPRMLDASTEMRGHWVVEISGPPLFVMRSRDSLRRQHRRRVMWVSGEWSGLVRRLPHVGGRTGQPPGPASTLSASQVISLSNAIIFSHNRLNRKYQVNGIIYRISLASSLHTIPLSLSHWTVTSLTFRSFPSLTTSHTSSSHTHHHWLFFLPGDGQYLGITPLIIRIVGIGQSQSAQGQSVSQNTSLLTMNS